MGALLLSYSIVNVPESASAVRFARIGTNNATPIPHGISSRIESSATVSQPANFHGRVAAAGD